MERYQDIDSLIAKVLNGTASKEEKIAVNRWAGLSTRNAYQFQKLKAIWKQSVKDPKIIGHEEQKEKIWETYQSEFHRSINVPRVPFYRRAWFRTAAVFALLLIPLYVLYFNQDHDTKDKTSEMRMISKSNPTGQKSLIQLPDGSRVWLNADSHISFKEDFSDSIRSIELVGEAYFEVLRDSLKPFIVVFDSLSVRVLGTEFNISAFEADTDLRVTLVDGSVQVSNTRKDADLIMEPGTGIIYSKENRSYREFTKNDNPELFHRTTEWRFGKLIFDGQNFEGFVKEIQRWYGVQVLVEEIRQRVGT